MFLAGLMVTLGNPKIMVFYLALPLFATRARHLLTSRKAVKVANRTSATVMAGAAAVIATR